MLKLLTSSMGRAAREVFVEQHHRPHRHPSWAFRDHSRSRRCCHNTWELGTPTRRLVTRALDAPNVGLDLHFDDIARVDTWKRCQRLATWRTVFGRLASVVHFHYHRQGATITAAVSYSARLLSPLSRMGHTGCADSLGTGGLLALRPVEALVEVAHLSFKRFHLRLQGRFALHEARVLGPPVVGFPLDLPIVLLRQHHRLLGKGRGMLRVGWCKLGGGNALWLCTFHRLWLYQLFMESPIFSDGHDGVPEYLLPNSRKSNFATEPAAGRLRTGGTGGGGGRHQSAEGQVMGLDGERLDMQRRWQEASTQIIMQQQWGPSCRG